MKNNDHKKQEDMKQDEQQPSVIPVEFPGEPVADEQTKKIQALQEERDQVFARLQRAAADLQNYQKKASRERQEAVQRAELNAIERFVFPLIDDLERAVKSATVHGYKKEDPLVKGVNLVLQHAFGQLKQLNIEPIETEGKTFDPMYHEAIMELPAGEGVAEKSIVQIVSRGYTQDGKTIRPARVVIAKSVKPPVTVADQSVQNDGEVEKE